jgi:sugar lactone lactonase YvrE
MPNSEGSSTAMSPRVIAEGLSFTECPRWHDNRLWFSDVLAGEVFVCDADGSHRTCVASLATVTGVPDAWATGLGWDHQGRLLVISMKACQVLRQRQPGGAEFEVLADLSHLFAHHCNDMVVDTRGRAYVGGYSFDMVKGDKPSPSQLVLVDVDGSVTIAADSLMVPNGVVLIDDGRTLVVAESHGLCLTAFDVDRARGSLSNRRTWAALKHGPDGICADAEGCIWVSSPPTHEFVRVREGGEVVDRISTGDRLAIACMLGGPHRRTLYMCTNRPSPAGSTTQEVKEARRSLIEAVDVKVSGAGLP